jgi:hypothetical protein
MKEKIIEILKSEEEPMGQLLFMENYGKVADKVISLFSQPNGGDRVVNENEPQKKVCRNCGIDKATVIGLCNDCYGCGAP